MENNILILKFVLAFINFVAFFMVMADKKRSLGHEERFPEVYFFVMAIFFTSLGVFLGLFVFRHKIRKLYFPLGIGFLLIQQIFLLLYIFNST